MRQNSEQATPQCRQDEQPVVQRLDLQGEAKIDEILADVKGSQFEASGVIAMDGAFYVIFDNLAHIGRIEEDLSRKGNSLILDNRQDTENIGYEDIAYDGLGKRFYLLIEAKQYAKGIFMAKVEEFDEHFRHHQGSTWLNFPLDRPNKGLEGLTCVHRGEKTYLLGLCEGNWYLGGEAGRRPGGGRILVFSKGQDCWENTATIHLPRWLPFEDYSSLAVSDDRIVVVSQTSSALWVGKLSSSSWEVADEGRIYGFPLDDNGETVYCNVEGVSWMDADRVVIVSDRAKGKGQNKRCSAKDQSIHIFTIPASSKSAVS